MSTKNNALDQRETEILTTFYIGDSFYGIEVMKVQEVTGKSDVIPVPLAPEFVRGLINLRGQLATALGLRELFGVAKSESHDQMSVVCRMDGSLVSLIVDAIGDVVEADRKDFEAPPSNMPTSIRQFIKGIYKTDGKLLSVIDLEKLSQELSPST